ncbi:MAG: heparan-alpha-glucosaminide N-acetyltransferase [Rhodoferax sp.]
MKPQRIAGVDTLRGIAMLWMTVYHFSFDLNNAGLIQQDFYSDPVWTWQRTLILSLFLLCAGAGQALAAQHDQSWPQFWRRWAQIAVCALLVTAGSAMMFPNSYIYFGVLHGMAVMLLIARLTVHWGRWLWWLGGAAIAMKYIASFAIDAGILATFLNEKPLNWLGLVNTKPITEDYVPLVPWMGLMWWGVAATQWWLPRYASLSAWSPPVALRPLAWLGNWSLSYYMLHQPVLLALLWLVL